MENPKGKEIVFSRVFDASKELVWKAWTDPEMLKKWWGPKGFTAPVIKSDFRVGGKYLYCMRGTLGPGQPEMDMWSTGIFKEIIPMEKIVCTDSFSDEKGNIISPTKFGMGEDFPSESDITVTFEDQEQGKTKLTVRYAPQTEAAYDAMLKTGMNEGWNQTLDKLGESLRT